jgi:hypothetical protein
VSGHRVPELARSNLHIDSAEMAAPAGSSSSDELKVSLDGARFFLLSRAEVRKHPETMLGALLEATSLKPVGADGLSFPERSAQFFEAIVEPFYRTGTLPLLPPSGLKISEADYFEALDFWQLRPSLPSATPPAMVNLFGNDVELAYKAMTGQSKIFDRLRAQYVSAVRFVSPFNPPTVFEETENLAAFLGSYAEKLPSESAESSFESAKSDTSWCGDQTYSKAIIKGAERLMKAAQRELMGTASSSSHTDIHIDDDDEDNDAESVGDGATFRSASGRGGVAAGSSSSTTAPIPGVALAATAAHLNARINAASALIANSPIAQHLLKRRFANEGLQLSFSLTCWPELAAMSASSGNSWPNPYSDAPDLNAGSQLVNLWAEHLKGSGHVEIFVHDQSLPQGLRDKVKDAGVIGAKKGVMYLLVDVTTA